MPAMMLMPGIENEYIRYCEDKTEGVHAYYAEIMKQLQPNTVVQHYQPKGTFGKQQGSTISQPFKLEGRYEYDFDTGKTTRSGAIKKNRRFLCCRR